MNQFHHEIHNFPSKPSQEFLEKIFIENEVTKVFHAAAYKHVTLVESNPIQGIINNVFSTILDHLASLYGVLKSKTSLEVGRISQNQNTYYLVDGVSFSPNQPK